MPNPATMVSGYCSSSGPASSSSGAAGAEVEEEVAMEVDYGSISSDDNAAKKKMSSSVAAAAAASDDESDAERKFPGASGASQQPLEKIECDVCHKYSAHPSFVGFMYDVPGLPWVVIRDATIHKALGNEVKNHFAGKTPIVQVCVYCAEKHHMKTYTRQDKRGRPSVTSEWTRLKARSRGMAVSKSKAKKLAFPSDRKHELDPT